MEFLNNKHVMIKYENCESKEVKMLDVIKLSTDTSNIIEF